MGNPEVAPREVRRLKEGAWSPAETDRVTVEEPLEIRIDGRPLTVLMRTPGDDEALASGFLLTEAIVESLGSIAEINTGEGVDEGPGDRGETNVVDVRLTPGRSLDWSRFERNFFASASCGICGKASLEAMAKLTKPLGGRWRVDPELLSALPEKLRAAQPVFEKTGSLHAAGLFDLEGELIAAAEDVGRHNAVDKVVGRAAAEGSLPLERHILLVSGRISFEIAQKSLMAGIPMLAAVSGASSLAIDLAEDQGQTLVGFVRGRSMTIYHGGWRIDDGGPTPGESP